MEKVFGISNEVSTDQWWKDKRYYHQSSDKWAHDWQEFLLSPRRYPEDSMESIQAGFDNILGSHKALNYRQLIKQKTEDWWGAICHWKYTSPHSHLDFLPENLRDISNKHGKSFNRTFLTWWDTTTGHRVWLYLPTTPGSLKEMLQVSTRRKRFWTH